MFYFFDVLGYLRIRDPKFDPNSKDTIRVSVTNILKHENLGKTRILPREQFKAIQNLKKGTNIIVLPVDKGRAIVIMNREDYQRKINNLL